MLLEISISLTEYLCCSSQSLGDGVFFLSAIYFLFFRNQCWYSRNAVAAVRYWKYWWCQALALVALIALDISAVHTWLLLCHVYVEAGEFCPPKSGMWPFCLQHKDVSNLLKLSRNDNGCAGVNTFCIKSTAGFLWRTFWLLLFETESKCRKNHTESSLKSAIHPCTMVEGQI